MAQDNLPPGVAASMEYLRTGGLGEVIGLTSLALREGWKDVRSDTEMAMALCLLAARAEAAEARIKGLETARGDDRAIADLVRAYLRDREWVEHHGKGDPPRETHWLVEVRFRDGDTAIGARWNWDENWGWEASAEQHDGDIVAYRAFPDAAALADTLHPTS